MNDKNRCNISIDARGRLQFSAEPRPAMPNQGGENAALVDSLYRYLRRLSVLTSETYPDLAPILPPHLTRPVNLFVAHCDEGALFRIELSPASESAVFVLNGGTTSWQDTCTFWSAGCIRFEGQDTEVSRSVGPLRMSMVLKNPDGNVAKELFSKEICQVFPADLAEPDVQSVRPMPSITFGGAAAVQVEGTWGSLKDDNVGETPFVHVTPPSQTLLPWCEINFYTRRQLARWQPDLAEAIAERDVLFCASNALANQTNILFDALHATRGWYFDQLARFRQLIEDASTLEETIHQTLRECPWMLAWGAKFVRSKVAFGPKHVSDFVVAGADGSYTLVELERATHRLF